MAARRFRWHAAAAALVGAAAVAVLVPGWLRPAGDPPAEGGVIRAEPASIPLGDLAPRARRSVPVVLRNVSDRAVRIRSAVCSCACTTATVPAAAIPPHGTAEATITVDPPEVAEDESIMKTVTYLPEEGEPASVTLQGIVRAPRG